MYINRTIILSLLLGLAALVLTTIVGAMVHKQGFTPMTYALFSVSVIAMAIAILYPLKLNAGKETEVTS